MSTTVDAAGLAAASPAEGMLAARISEAYVTLTPGEQQVADFLWQHPEESALYNSSELARLIGVSKATVSRLFRRLGFASAYEARDLLRSQRGAGVPVAVDVPDDSRGAQLQRDLENLRRCYAAVDSATVDAVAGALAAAPRVTVVGFRSGFPLALHLKQQLTQARDNVRLLPEPGQSIAEELTDLGADDVVIVVAIRRRPAGFATVFGTIAASGARILVLADPTMRYTPVRAEWLIETPIESASPFDSLASAASIISLLAGAVLQAGGAEAVQRVASIDRAYASLGELEAP